MAFITRLERFYAARTWLAMAFALLFVCAGIFHFVRSGFYVEKLPAFVPAKTLLVYAVGAAELGLALFSLYRPARRVASFAIMTFLLLVIPINILNAWRAPELMAAIRPFLLLLLALWAFVNGRSATDSGTLGD